MVSAEACPDWHTVMVGTETLHHSIISMLKVFQQPGDRRQLTPSHASVTPWARVMSGHAIMFTA